MPLISIVTPCYNEEGNARELHARLAQVLAAWIAQQRERGEAWEYEHLFIDNASRDETPAIVRELAARDSRVRAIFNNRNFGHVRSPYHGLLQARGDVVVIMASDLQDPPELIPAFLEKWREGFKIVVGQKAKSEETPLFFAIRKAYYRLVDRLADVELLENVTGFGLYDREVLDQFRALDDPYPYVRGLISELGYPTAKVVYTQPTRKRGVSKNNFYTLYDIAMLGITSHSKVPLRLATMLGFAMSLLSFLMGLGYLLYKLLFWSRFDAGVAPLVIGLFFIGSVQLFFIGIVGEYVGFIHTHILKRPLVTERERIGFGQGDGPRDAQPQVLGGSGAPLAMHAARIDKETAMNTADGEKMSGIPTPTPGSAEGEENIDAQSKVPPASHTPGSAEGGDIPAETGEDA